MVEIISLSILESPVDAESLVLIISPVSLTVKVIFPSFRISEVTSSIVVIMLDFKIVASFPAEVFQNSRLC